jgi:hypothetical protein
MSTRQRNPRSPNAHKTRVGAAAALGALIAIGASVLILTLNGPNHTTSASAATQTRQTTTHGRRACTRYFRDPATHALLCIKRAGPVAPRR